MRAKKKSTGNHIIVYLLNLNTILVSLHIIIYNSHELISLWLIILHTRSVDYQTKPPILGMRTKLFGLLVRGVKETPKTI